MECSIINPALSLLMKRLVIGQRQKAPYFAAFHWPPHGSLVAIGQHFVVVVVVVALLFYAHGKHLRSCRDGQLT